MPNYAPAHFHLGLALQRLGEKSEAAREVERLGKEIESLRQESAALTATPTAAAAPNA